jgi:hypothetical protein
VGAGGCRWPTAAAGLRAAGDRAARRKELRASHVVYRSVGATARSEAPVAWVEVGSESEVAGDGNRLGPPLRDVTDAEPELPQLPGCHYLQSCRSATPFFQLHAGCVLARLDSTQQRLGLIVFEGFQYS